MQHYILSKLFLGLIGIIGIIGLFLSVWVIVPAPIFAFLPLSIGAPEISPWLIGLNLLLALLTIKGARHRLNRLILGCSLVGLVFSLRPLAQFPATHQQAAMEFTQALGTTYLQSIPESLQMQLRPHPFVWKDAFLGIPASPSVRHTSNLTFPVSEDVALALEVYCPPQVGIYPAIVMIHGGAWQGGSPADHATFGRYMAAQGYVVWAVTYRYAPRYQFPTQLTDIQAALAFVQQHAGEYETDLTRLALMGRSAGAHLAMLAAYRPDAPSIRAVVNYYGPVDLAAGYANPPDPDPINTRAILEAFLGGTPDQLPDRYQAASPIYWSTRPLPPSLLVYGGKDHIVQAKYGRALNESLRRSGNRPIFLEIPWAEHSFDSVFNGVSNQLALYYTERFLAWALH